LGRFAALSDYKSTIMEALVTDDDIVKVLLFNDPDFTSKTIPDGFNRKSLIYSKVFPYLFIPDITAQQSTFITMKFGHEPFGKTFRHGFIYFYVITHKEIVRTNIGKLRYDYAIDKIDEIFNKSRDITIGRLEWEASDDISINKNWFGSFILYKATNLQTK
jgi:hypothetical protein